MIDQIDASSESIGLNDVRYRITQELDAGTEEISLVQLQRRIKRWNLSLSDNSPGPLFKGVVSQENVKLCAANVAEALALVLQKRHAQSDGTTSADESELLFENVLSILRLGCVTKNKELVAQGFEILTNDVVEAISSGPFSADPDSSEDVALGSIRVANLIHRVCAVAAAIPYLQARQLESRSAASLSGIASRRTRLTMPGLPLDEVHHHSFTNFVEGDRLALLAYADTSQWVDRPEKPYTQLQLHNGEELRVHYKNMRRLGVHGQHWVWARCKFEGHESEGNVPYGVAEFEGPTSHANICWESWLQLEGRGQYDYTPESVHLYTSGLSHQLDVYSRLANEDLGEDEQ